MNEKRNYKAVQSGFRLVRPRHLAIFLVTTVLGNAVTAAEPSSEELVAVFPESFPPYFQVTSNGVPIGFAIEVMEEIAKQGKLTIKYTSAPTWEDAIKRVANGEVDLIPNLGITDERRAMFDFALPYETFEVRLFVRSDKTTYVGLSDFSGAGLVGVVKSNIGKSLVEASPGVRYRVFDAVTTAMVDLKNGTIEGIVFPEQVFLHFASEMGYVGQFKAVGPPLAVIKRSVAVRKGNTRLLEKLNAAIPTVMSTDAFRRIYSRWFPEQPGFWTARRVAILLVPLVSTGAVLNAIIYLRRLRATNRVLSTAHDFCSTVLQSVLEGVITVDRSGAIRSINSAAQSMFGYAAEDILYRPLSDLFAGEDTDKIVGSIKRDDQTHSSSQYSFIPIFKSATAQRKSGESFPVKYALAPARVGSGTLFVLTIRDVSEQFRLEQRIEFLVDHDQLTGLLNPHGLALVLRSLLGQARRKNSPLCCLAIGIMHFGQINETYGRSAGDQVLIEVGTFLRNALRKSDLFARDPDERLVRFGGDRFLIVLPDTPLEGAKALAERILAETVKLEICLDQERLYIDVKAGIAESSDATETAEQLLSHAETALQLAKTDPVSVIGIFSDGARSQVSQTERILDQVRDALLHDRLQLYFQPVLDLRAGKVGYYEVLSRIRLPNGVLLMPGDYITAAERFGLITRIDYRVLELSFAQLRACAKIRPGVALAINLGSAHIGDERLRDWLEHQFTNGGVNPRNIMFELTETAALQNLVQARSFMEPLRDLGCKFALDDFGVGFTSFAQLRALPVDTIKIDGTFIRQLDTSKEDQAVTRSIVDVAHSLNKTVVAEFVEREELMDCLRTFGVDYAQGYYIGKPQPNLVSLLGEMPSNGPAGVQLGSDRV